MPALAITTSGVPKREMKSSAAAASADASRTSPPYSTGRGSRDCASAARASARRANSPSRAPRRAYSRASAAPMPEDAPVRNTFTGGMPHSQEREASDLPVLGARLGDECVDDRRQRGVSAHAIGGG